MADPKMKKNPVSIGVGVMSFFQNIFQPRTNKSSPLGTLWQGEDAAQAFTKGDLASESLTKKESLRLCFRNCTPDSLLLCWVDSKGQPHHFYELPPATIVSGPVRLGDRTENTQTGDSFLLASGDNLAQARANKSLHGMTVMGGYRPSRTHARGTKESKYPVHVLTIEERWLDKGSEVCCCSPRILPRRFFLRGNHKRKREDDVPEQPKEDDDNDETAPTWSMEVCQGEMDLTPIDTSCKRYDSTELGGWPVRCEPDWDGGDANIAKTLAQDLEQCIKCLPPHAREALRSKETPMWINKTLRYGPQVCPINGRGLCYHPDAEWLQENGCTPEKAQCVELYTAKEYMEIRNLWGRGGLLIHEFSHAYHHKCLPNGYKNADIQRCYKAAMKEGLYDEVQVHGRQGPTARAYACSDCMEYFAELSAAFLGTTLDDDVEFNKWYPFNRKQIKEHDPRAYELLSRIWKVSPSETATSATSK